MKARAPRFVLRAAILAVSLLFAGRSSLAVGRGNRPRGRSRPEREHLGQEFKHRSRDGNRD